jgi:hypothetical protein
MRQNRNWERRATPARRTSRLISPRPPLGSFTKECRQKKTPLPAVASTEGNRRFFGANSVASALDHCFGRDPVAADKQPNTPSSAAAAKEDISIWQPIGHFYLALTVGCHE